jgi:hypothetical protein
MSQEETQTTEQTQETVEGLNINDLNTLRAIIDLASSRGAFKPTEMTAVGTTYTKLNNFLEQVAKQSEEPSQGTEE